jgi:O-acetylhomoserine (thiol)-lyase
MSKPKQDYHLETQLIHADNVPEKNRGATTLPIYQTTAYKFSSCEEISKVFRGEGAGHIYARISNPTVEVLERRLAALEGGLGAIATASGMAAITTTILTLAKAGQQVVASKSVFGGTYALLNKTIRELGVEVSFVDPAEPKEFEPAITKKTKAIFIETIGNPKMDVPDIAAISKIAKKHAIPLIVDSTMTTPALIRPKEFGANIIIISTSKFINGHGNSIGGVLIDCGNFNWRIEGYSEKYGALAFLAKARKEVFRDFGAPLSPFNAFLTSIGLETLVLRMERHCSNALALAEFLVQQREVKEVNFPGLKKSRFYQIAKKQFKNKFGSLFTFRLGSQKACFKFIDSLKLAYNLANLGDAKTLVIHPASTIFSEFSAAERKKLGVPDDLIRVSVGIEHIDDIIGDFEQALEKV